MEYFQSVCVPASECSRKWTFTLHICKYTLPLEHHQGSILGVSENLLTDCCTPRFVPVGILNVLFGLLKSMEYFRVCLCTSKWNVLANDIPLHICSILFL
ncbi:hypothetical protein AVEN_5850-1 [Araneus ventricosus]|uniref:F-box domain-containing protein n=1 Tax=Araneus ventricosus TaxID=182803 RepID=A0A4Y2S7A5_ARAVE|nr:hypothetical protein AVEN_5850-1 [Araneus ventricosus]